MIKDLKKDNFNIKTIIAIILFIMVICGIFGFIHETIYFLIKYHKFYKRGSTIGPWIPIYSFGAIINLFLLFKIKNSKFLIFILSSLLSGILEFITGFILDKYFNKKLWTYKNEFFNIKGYTCLKAIIFFGAATLILFYILYPYVKKIFSKNNKVLLIITYLVSILFFIDIILSVFIL